MRVLVVTVVHHPQDARIRHRQIPALLAAGHRVTYAAPFSATGSAPPPGVSAVDLPRAVGRRRAGALRAARRAVLRFGPTHDVVLVHDPELLVASAGLSGPVRVWDVHEDTAAALSLKAWLPVPLRPAVARGVRGVERLAERRWRLLLAEEGYRTRFGQEHPVVPNSSSSVPAEVPEPGPGRAVYVGHLTRARGALDLVEVARALAGRVRLDVVGAADDAVAPTLLAAQDAGLLHWHGFLPNDAALSLVEGATAGLSLLHDEPNYRHSRPTKVIEYMARGVPVVTTPTPPAAELVEVERCGLVVPFEDPEAAAAAVLRLHEDAALRRELGRHGHEAARRDHDWQRDATRFVEVLAGWSEGAHHATA